MNYNGGYSSLNHHRCNTRERIPKGQPKMDILMKQATQVTQTEKKDKDTTQYVLYTTLPEQTQMT